jgi:hypothetical protein
MLNRNVDSIVRSWVGLEATVCEEKVLLQEQTQRAVVFRIFQV